MYRLLRLPMLVLFIALAVSAGARDVSITILHTTDLHGTIRPTEIFYPTEEAGKDLGGLARCSTMIKKLRAENPNCLLVDAGDTIQGTAASFMSDGLMMVRALNHLRYDAWVWGNHEFDWGEEKLARCAAAAEVPLVTANVHGDATAAAVVGKLRPYLIKECEGVRIAIIGLDTPGIPNWSRPRLIPGLKFESSVEALNRVLPEVKRQKAGIIVLVAHQGRKLPDDHANQIQAIAERFPEIDVIIGGHTHRPVRELFVNNILYTQASYWGTYVGRVDLVYNTDHHKLTSRNARLIKMDASVAQDPQMLELAKPDLDVADKELARVVGTAAADFPVAGAPAHETPIHNLLCEAILDTCQRAGHPADIVIHGVLNDRVGLKKGPITVSDCWSLVPYDNFAGVFEVSPAQLKEILEEDADHYTREHFAGVYGMKLTLKATAPRGQRIISMTDRDGIPFAPRQRLRIAVNSFDLASAGMRKPRLRAIAEQPESKLVELDFLVRQVLVDFISARNKIAPKIYDWWQTGGGAGERKRRPSLPFGPPQRHRPMAPACCQEH